MNTKINPKGIKIAYIMLKFLMICVYLLLKPTD